MSMKSYHWIQYVTEGTSLLIEKERAR